MKKILLLIISLMILTGCEKVDPINEVKTDETNYYMQGLTGFNFYTDKTTCVEYIVYSGYHQGNIIPRLNADNTLKLNETCLKNKE